MKIQKALESKLRGALSPLVLKVINQSPQHNTPEGHESHFRVLIVSDRFQGLSSLKRHQMVHNIVKQELQIIHAFSQSAFTAEEWTARGGEIPASPPCQHKKST